MAALIWVTERVLEDVRGFPDRPRQTIGFALSEAQFGRKSDCAKPYKGFSRTGVFEIVADDVDSTYRALYATKIDDDVYVLHAFKKKSPRGSKVPKPAKDTIDTRLKRARDIAVERAALVVSAPPKNKDDR